jgi:diguanylate cyclase
MMPPARTRMPLGATIRALVPSITVGEALSVLSLCPSRGGRGVDDPWMGIERRQRHIVRAFWALVALTAVFALWTWRSLGGEEVTLYVDDLATVAAALIAMAVCIRAALGQEGRLRLFWWLIGLALAAWALGEVIWAYYDLVLGDIPAASWADAAYLAALPLTAAALLIHPALHGRASGKTGSLVDGGVLAASLFLLAWTLVLEPVREQTDLSSLGGLVTLAYPTSDVVIVFLVVLVIRGTTGGTRRDLWCLLAGLLLIAFSDAVYTYLTNVTNFSSGSVIDTGWFAGYLAIALGALSVRARPALERRAAPSHVLSPTAIVAPFVPLLAALLFVAIRIELGHELDRVTLIVAFVLVGLFLVRQVLLLVHLLSRREEIEGSVADRLVAALGEAAADPPDRSAAVRGAR